MNRTIIPDYLQQNFTEITPSTYLSSVSPLNEADHWVEAIACDRKTAQLLKIKKDQPCLKISRRTYTRKKNNKGLVIVNFAFLFHPGDRYRLGGHINF